MRESGPFRKTYGNDHPLRVSYGGPVDRDRGGRERGGLSPGGAGDNPRGSVGVKGGSYGGKGEDGFDGVGARENSLGKDVVGEEGGGGWRGRGVDAGKSDLQSAGTFKGLLKEKDRENSNLLEEIYKLNGEVGRISRELDGKDESYDELLRLRDNLMEANTN